MAHVPGFEGCDAETVFSKIVTKVQSTEARTLWGKLLEEIKRNGVNGAVSYLETEFTQVKEDIRREIDRLKSEK
jgi:hypothetical protein